MSQQPDSYIAVRYIKERIRRYGLEGSVTPRKVLEQVEDFIDVVGTKVLDETPLEEIVDTAIFLVCKKRGLKIPQELEATIRAYNPDYFERREILTAEGCLEYASKRLGLTEEEKEKVLETLRYLREMYPSAIRGTPCTQFGAVALFVLPQLGRSVTARDLASLLGVSEITIQRSYKLIERHIFGRLPRKLRYVLRAVKYEQPQTCDYCGKQFTSGLTVTIWKSGESYKCCSLECAGGILRKVAKRFAQNEHGGGAGSA